MRGWIKYSLFFSSFSPLFLILFVQNFNFEKIEKINLMYWLKNNFWHMLLKLLCGQWDNWFHSKFIAIILLILMIFPNVILFSVIQLSKKRTKRYLKVKEIVSRNNDVLNYISTYLITLFSYRMQELGDEISFLLLLLVLSIVYLNANIIFINPILIIFKLNIYEVKDDFDRTVYIISKRRISLNSEVKIVIISDTLMWEAS